MTEHPTDAMIERLAYLTACVRQGESLSGRCEGPGEYEVNLAREWVQRVLKAMEAAKPSTPIDDMLIENRADWLLDAIAGATQNRMFLRGDPEYDAVAGEAILLNGEKAIRLSIEAIRAPNVS